MDCQACTTRGKTWNGSDPKCAFKSTTFISDNWNCATVSLIRRIAELEDNGDVQYRRLASEEQYATINVSEVAGLHAMVLWVQWYKNRGPTQAMWLLFENLPPRQPSESECLMIIEHYKKYTQ